MKLINNSITPLLLDDGTQLASAGTEGSTREVKKISDRDKRRYVDTGRVSIAPEEKPVARQVREKEAKD